MEENAKKHHLLNHLLNSNLPSLKYLMLDISCHLIHWDWVTLPNLSVTEVHEDISRAIIYSGWVTIAKKISTTGFLEIRTITEGSTPQYCSSQYKKISRLMLPKACYSLHFQCSSALFPEGDASRWCYPLVPLVLQLVEKLLWSCSSECSQKVASWDILLFIYLLIYVRNKKITFVSLRSYEGPTRFLLSFFSLSPACLSYPVQNQNTLEERKRGLKYTP